MNEWLLWQGYSAMYRSAVTDVAVICSYLVSLGNWSVVFSKSLVEDNLGRL